MPLVVLLIGLPLYIVAAVTLVNWMDARLGRQPILVEVMADLETRDGGDWTPVAFGSRRRVFVEDTPLFVPDIRDHIALYRLFGRPKDLARVEQLERLIA